MSKELSGQNCDRSGKPLTYLEGDRFGEKGEEGLCSACEMERTLDNPTTKRSIAPDKKKEIETSATRERKKVNTRRRKQKEPHHTENMFWLTDAASTKESKKAARIFGLESNEKQVAAILRMLKRNFSRCPACGGFQPELQLIYNDTAYSFTCVRIRNKDKVIETDYNKLAEWLLAQDYGVEFCDKLRAIVEAIGILKMP
jgi:hypothetical protein